MPYRAGSGIRCHMTQVAAVTGSIDERGRFQPHAQWHRLRIVEACQLGDEYSPAANPGPEQGAANSANGKP